jgi:transcriptional regulator with XRE-family HTH domain
LPAITDLRLRRKLAAALKALREDTGLSGNRFAQRLGWIQTKVSKLETGSQFPSEDDIRAWTQAAGTPAAADELLAQRAVALVEYNTFREQYRASGGAAARQADIAALEATVTNIAKFQPAMIPAQIQTVGYAREVLRLPSGPAAWGASEAEIDAIAATRVERQQAILYQPDKQIQLVMLEAALRTRLCSRAAMAGQLDRMLALGGLPSLELSIIPFTALVPVFPLSGFIIYDEHLAIVETLTGEQQLSDPAEVNRYVQWFGLLHDAAVHGRDTVPLIQRALNDLKD